MSYTRKRSDRKVVFLRNVHKMGQDLGIFQPRSYVLKIEFDGIFTYCGMTFNRLNNSRKRHDSWEEAIAWLDQKARQDFLEDLRRTY